MFTKDLRSLQKLQVMPVVLGADLVFSFPLLFKCSVLLDPSWCGVPIHTLGEQGRGFHPLPSKRAHHPALPVRQRGRNLGNILFAGMWGQAIQEPSGGVVRVSESLSGADVFHPFLESSWAKWCIDKLSRINSVFQTLPDSGDVFNDPLSPFKIKKVCNQWNGRKKKLLDTAASV